MIPGVGFRPHARAAEAEGASCGIELKNNSQHKVRALGV